MIKASLFVILTALSFGAVAQQWTKYGETDGYIFFVDLSTVLVDGDIRNYWGMTNYQKRSSSGYMSSRTKGEIHCKKGVYRSLYFVSYTGPNLSGDSTSPYPPLLNWDHVPPNTPAAELMRLVCSK